MLQGLLIEDVHEVFAAHWFWKHAGAVAHNKDLEGRPSMVGGVDILRTSMANSAANMTTRSMEAGQPIKTVQ